MEYNGVVSEFNGVHDGQSATIVGKRKISYANHYKVRNSKTNTLQVTRLIEIHKEDGSVSWSFYCNVRVERGHQVNVEIIN